MSYAISQNDINLLFNRNKLIYVQLELLEKTSSGSFTVLDMLEGNLISGDYTEDAESDIRRTLSLTLIITSKTYTVGEFNRIWIDKYMRVSIGQMDSRTKTIYWYKKGVYIFDNADTAVSTEENSITISCSDLVSTLDGTHNGQIDAVEVKIPANSIIRDAMIQTITQLGGIVSYRVDDIGEYTCLQGTVSDYLERRELYPDWNKVPYDLEFSTGCTVWEIVIKLRDLYPGFEAFFDEEGTFICQRIPNCDTDEIIVSDEILNPLVISENSTTDLSSVRNVTRIYGHSIETDRYSEQCITSGTNYQVTLDSFELVDNIVIGVKVDSTNVDNMNIVTIGSSTSSPILIVERTIETIITDTESGTIIVDTNIPEDAQVEVETTVKYLPCPAGKFEAGNVYCFKYSKCLNTGEDESHMYWVYQGQYQIEAIYTNDNYESEFCVQKIGKRIQVLSGGEFDDITTDALAMENASYQTWLKSRLTDTITLEIVDIPFLQVNTKIEYKPKNSTKIESYIIKSIQESFMQGTATVEMMKFYRLYPNFMGSRNYNDTISAQIREVIE